MGRKISRRYILTPPPKVQPSSIVSPPARETQTASREDLHSEPIQAKVTLNMLSEVALQDLKPFDVDKIPTELWGLIFEFALCDEWNGTTPSLIKAMRGHRRFYPECMLAWYKQKRTYILHAKNHWSFLDMPDNILATITKVKIIIDDSVSLHPLLRWSDMKVVEERLPMSLHDLSMTAALATSVTSVTLECHPTTSNLFFYYPSKFGIFFSGFKGLKYAAATAPVKLAKLARTASWVSDGYVSPDSQANSMQAGIKEANSFFGVVPKLDRVYADTYDEKGIRLPRKEEDREKWVWIAEEGKFLKEIELPMSLQMERPTQRAQQDDWSEDESY